LAIPCIFALRHHGCRKQYDDQNGPCQNLALTFRRYPCRLAVIGSSPPAERACNLLERPQKEDIAARLRDHASQMSRPHSFAAANERTPCEIIGERPITRV
jgi:hypothetical protein